MKRKLLAIILAAVFAFSLIQVTVFADEIRVTIEGQQVTFQAQQPVIIDGRTLVPVRGVFEHLSFEVDWDGAARQATLASDEFTVILTIGSASFTTNGISHTLDVPAQIIGGSTMLPIRAVLESVGYYLDWDDAARTVLIWAEAAEADAPLTGDIPAYITIRGERFSTDLTELILEQKNLTDADIASLRYMVNLEGLGLYSNRISDLSPLSGLTNLEALNLAGNRINDLSPLSNLVNLRWLHLGENQISDLSPLSNLTNLWSLGLGGNRISDLRPLSNLTNLEMLFLWGNRIDNLNPLSSLTNLELLFIGDNRISDIRPLSGLINLESLSLFDNRIYDLGPLSGLVNLEWLYMWNNRISDLSPLSGLTDLSFIDACYNLISDLQPLARLVNLTFLCLEYNPIIDWSPVAHVETVYGRP